MKLLLIIYFFIIGSLKLINPDACKSHVNPGTENLKPVTELPAILTECSGMLSLGDGTYLAHNDSGNKPHLYIFDQGDIEKVRTVIVSGVKNNDWEELASDDKFIYIGDFGNNSGTRKNLMIYKISKLDLLQLNVVKPEFIRFRYANQTRFEHSNRHNFDCEAFISYGDSLYLFSKNRGDFRSDMYSVSKKPGEYTIRKQGSFDSEGLVTGADFRTDGSNGQLVILGYSIHGKAYYPFIYHFEEVEGIGFLDGAHRKHKFNKVLQTESIVFQTKNKVLISNEEENNSKGYLFEVNLN